MTPTTTVRPWLKKRWVWGLAVLALIGIAGAFDSDKKPTEVAQLGVIAASDASLEAAKKDTGNILAEVSPTTADTSAPPVKPTTMKPSARPGSPAVFQQIAADTNCESLQETFDGAEATSKRRGTVPDGPAFEGARGKRWSAVGVAYMEAADDRMREVGCY